MPGVSPRVPLVTPLGPLVAPLGPLVAPVVEDGGCSRRVCLRVPVPLLVLVLKVALRVVSVLLLRSRAVRLHAQLLQRSLQPVVLVTQLPVQAINIVVNYGPILPGCLGTSVNNGLYCHVV